MRALDKLSRGDLKDVIHKLSVKPFSVDYWLHHQLDIWREYWKKLGAYMSVDATGSILKRIKRSDGTLSQVIFLYEAVINFNGYQYPVTHMITKAHDAINIGNWFRDWFQKGAPVPKKVVIDGSLALLNALVDTCTQSHCTQAYLNSTFRNIKPDCQICFDISHFIKKYAVFLKCGKQKKKFLLCCIGQLILCTNIQDAEEVLESLFVMLLSESSGNWDSQEKSWCELKTDFLRVRFTNAVCSSQQTSDVQLFGMYFVKINN